MTRTLQPGSVEYVTAKITETTGQNLTGVTAQMAVVPYGTQPTVWATATVVYDAAVMRTSLLVTAASGTWAVFVRLTDTPEQPIPYAGAYNVP